MQDVASVRAWLAQAASLVVLTGAGISAESGVPTFRGEGGLWRKFSPEQLANPDAFARDPRLVWEWYDWRRSLISKCRPNPGHLALAELENRFSEFMLITQNVDGLHDVAGSRRILKLHGDIWDLKCTRCNLVSRSTEVPLFPLPPICACGGLLRPGVVWFGEALPEQVLERAWVAVSRADLCLVVGTSSLVQPAASLPVLAKEKGARVVELNLEPTPISDSVDASLAGKAGQLLPQLVK